MFSLFPYLLVPHRNKITNFDPLSRINTKGIIRAGRLKCSHTKILMSTQHRSAKLCGYIFDLLVSSIMVYLTLCDTNPLNIYFSLTHTNTHTDTYTHRQTITQNNEKRRSGYCFHGPNWLGTLILATLFFGGICLG